MPEKFEVIVVGAGLAGLSAAYTMATQGIKVAVIERGDYPGAKNVMGGVLYRQPAAEVFPEFWTTAPLERPVVERQCWVLADGSACKTAHRSAAWAAAPHHAYTVQRGAFDRWLGEQVSKAGALIIPATTVTELLRDGRRRVIGVRTSRSDGDLLADIVILADGAVSLLAEKIDLHPRWRPEHLALAVKEVLAPPGDDAAARARAIEQRFALGSGEGVAIDMAGTVTEGMLGSAFLTTNRETLSFGVSVLLSELTAAQRHPYALLQAAKTHPAVAPLLADCTPLEYTAHLQPAGGFAAIPKLYGEGVLVVGDAAHLYNTVYREGANLAMISGKLAGETAVKAHNLGDYSVGTLAGYAEALRQSFVLKDLEQYRHVPAHLQRRRAVLTEYPGLLNRMATALLTVDGTPKREQRRAVWALAGNALTRVRELLALYRVLK